MKPRDLLFIVSSEHDKQVTEAYVHKMIETSNQDHPAARCLALAATPPQAGDVQPADRFRQSGGRAGGVFCLPGMRYRKAAAGFCYRLLLALVMALAMPQAHAQAWPAKPIRVVVGTGPAGAPDILARIIGNRLGERLGQAIVIDLKPGGGGVIAAETVAKAPADGYTWLLSTTTNLAITPHLRRRLPYDTAMDFIAVSLVARAANVLLVGKHVPANSVAELLALARSRPGQLNYGSAGIGSPAHLAGELLSTLAGVKMTHIPYKGAAQALNEVVGGQIDLIMTSPVAAKTFMQGAQVKALATTGARRDPALPQLPPVGETVAGYEITQWWGLVLRSGTPQAIVERIHTALIATLREPAVTEMIAAQGAVAMPLSMAEFAAFIDRERERYGDLVKRANVPVED